MKLWDFVNNINKGVDSLKGLTDTDEALKEYTPFLINRALSYFGDTVHLANEMNRSAHLDKKLQHDFLVNIIRPKKRFSKWSKTIKNADVELIMESLECSPEKAREALRILTKEDIKNLKKELEKGGSYK